MAELMRHPKAMAKAQKEPREAFRGKAKIAESDIIDKLHYLKQVIKETLRLHPSLPLLLPRLCHENTDLVGYTFMHGLSPKTTKFGRKRIAFQMEQLRTRSFWSWTSPGMTFGLVGMENLLAQLLFQLYWTVLDGTFEELDIDETFAVILSRKNDL